MAPYITSHTFHHVDRNPSSWFAETFAQSLKSISQSNLRKKEKQVETRETSNKGFR